MLIVETLATIMTLAGLYLVAEQYKSGFIIGGVSNILWIIWGLSIAGLPFFILQGGLFLINLRGLIK